MSYFGTIYADTELPSRARAVYMYLRDRSDAEGKCWPGIKTIASDMKLSRSTVKRALDDLYGAGLLTREPRCRILEDTAPLSREREQYLQSLLNPVTQAQKRSLSAKGRLRSFAEPRGGS